MGILKTKRIVSSNNKSSKIFEALFDDTDFLHVNYTSPKEYVQMYWEKYHETTKTNNSLNGNIFEIIINTLLYREGLLPFYTQAKVAFVPNIVYDTLLYTPSRPISLSLKTSLRERYKQADLEAIALKYVHRQAKCYLLTLDTTEANDNKEKIRKGAIIGLDRIIDCNSDDINDMIAELHSIKKDLCESHKIDIIKGNLVKSDNGNNRK